MTTNVLFSAFPYAALAVLVGGLVARYLSTSARGADVNAEAAEAWALFGGGKIWRTGVLALALLHLAGLIVPQAILLWNGVPLRLYLLEGSGLAFGLLALGWWAGVMRRHFQLATASAGSEIAEGTFLALLFVGIASGLLTATVYRWGSSWGAATLAPYGTSLLHGAPLVVFVDQMPLLVQLHVLSMFALMTVFPFTRAACVAMLGARWAFGLPTAPLSAVSGAAREWFDRYDPASWIWPEEICPLEAEGVSMTVLPSSRSTVAAPAPHRSTVAAPALERAAIAETPRPESLAIEALRPIFRPEEDGAVREPTISSAPAATDLRASTPATLPPHSGVRDIHGSSSRGSSLEADAAMDTGSDVG